MADGSTGDDATYGGLIGAFPYAFRTSDSLVFRSYVVVSALLGLLVAGIVALALVVLVADTLGSSPLVTLSRSFYILVGLLVVAPLLAPVLFVARRHRLGVAAGDRYDRRLALSGYLFVVALYVGLIITIPQEQQTAPSGAMAPLVSLLYALPQLAGLVPPLGAAVAILLVHRRSRGA